MPSKSRSWTDAVGLLGTVYDGNGFASQRYGRNYNSQEAIIGQNNPGPPFRSGGMMLLNRIIYTHKLSSGYLGSVAAGVLKSAYVGKFDTAFLPTAMPLPNFNLSALGTEAISRTIPTSPSASLAVFIGELRDFPGMIIQTRKFFHRLMKDGIKLSKKKVTIGQALNDLNDHGNLAGNYLNLQFGWLPFLRDLHSFYQVGKKLNDQVATLRRNNMGKRVHRSRTLRQWNYTDTIQNVTYNTSTAVLTPSVHSFLYDSGTGCASKMQTVSQKGKIWFEASYSYYSPEIASMPDWVLKAEILGLTLDPAVIYQLTPWSWLLDWFTTVGPSVSNAVQFAKHHVVMRYGYVMATKTSVNRYTATQRMRSGYQANANSPKVNLTAEVSCLGETKERVVANPYGFGATWEGLSPYQLSILAALGISRR